MKRVEQLIDMARQLSNNTSYGTGSGVPQKVFVQYAQNAQDSLLKNVVNLKTKYLRTTTQVSVVSGQEQYDYPANCYMHHIETIRPLTGVGGTYSDFLVNLTSKETLSPQIGYPYGYILKKDGYYLSPPISNGFLEVTFTESVPQLQKRSGIITARTINGSNQITALTVGTTGSYDAEEINDNYYLCVVNKHGTQVAKNIEYASQLAGVFTLSPQTLGTGETISVGDYITIGQNTTNLPDWPDVCESYLLKYMVYNAKYSDASNWSDEAKQDMADSFTLLSGSFATLSDDICEIPITNYDYL